MPRRITLIALDDLRLYLIRYGHMKPPKPSAELAEMFGLPVAAVQRARVVRQNERKRSRRSHNKLMALLRTMNEERRQRLAAADRQAERDRTKRARVAAGGRG